MLQRSASSEPSPGCRHPLPPGRGLARITGFRTLARLRRAFGRLPQATKRFRSPAGARVTSLCWPTPPQERWRTAKPARRAEGRMPGVKRSNPEKWPDSIRRPYKPAVSRGLDQRSSTRRPTVATPRRIWKLRTLDLVVPAQAGTQCLCFALLVLRFAGALLWPLLLRAWSALLFPGPLGDGEAGTIRPRSGHRQGWRCLFDRTGVRPKSPAPTHGLAGQDARRASPRGVVFSWLLLFWTSKREVARAPAGARNRFVARDNAEARAPTPTLSRSSSRSASLFKAKACGAWSLQTGTSNIPGSSAPSRA